METIKRFFLISGFVILHVVVIQGEEKPNVNIEGLNLGYTSNWITKLSESPDKVDLLEINFNSPKRIVQDSDISVPDTTGLKMNKIKPPKLDENMEKKPNG